MVYLASSLVALILLFIDTSFLPHFSYALFGSVLMLPYIVLISHKDRTIFPIFLAAASGILLDTTSQNVLPVYSIVFTTVVLCEKIFFARFTAYGETRAYITLLLFGLAGIYAFTLPLQLSKTFDASFVMPLLLNVVLNLVLLAIYSLVFRKYFDWVEGETESRYR